MNPALNVLALAGFAIMFALPKLFFRADGKMNLRWWLTGAPFAVSAHAVWLTWAGFSPQLLAPGSVAAIVLDTAGMFVIVGAIAMMAATVASHRVPLALWHQEGEQNAPKQIITYGPYRLVRHPFYVSFIMLSVGTALITRDLVGIAAVPVGVLSLDWTVRGEEKKLLASELGDEYGAYRARTGRFVPRLSRS